MIGVDTNVLLRWLVRDQLIGEAEFDQQQALSSLFESGDEQLFINEIVVAEIAWVLKQRAKLPKAQIVDVIDGLLNMERMVVKDKEILLAALDRYSQFPGDFSDHLIGEVNTRNGCRTTLTFDKAAAKSEHFTELTR